MNKKGGGSLGDSVAVNYIVYLILLVVVFFGMFYYITGFQDGAFALEDIYAKEIVSVINSAGPGEEVYLDVTKPTGVAFDNKKNPSDIFIFDNANNKITVSLRKGTGTSFSYFNNVDVVDYRLETPSVGAGANTNRIYFKIAEKAK